MGYFIPYMELRICKFIALLSSWSLTYGCLKWILHSRKICQLLYVEGESTRCGVVYRIFTAKYHQLRKQCIFYIISTTKNIVQVSIMTPELYFLVTKHCLQSNNKWPRRRFAATRTSCSFSGQLTLSKFSNLKSINDKE